MERYLDIYDIVLTGDKLLYPANVIISAVMGIAAPPIN